MITAKIISDLESHFVQHIKGDLSSVAQHVLPPDLADKHSLVFATKADQLALAVEKQAAIIVGHKSLTPPPQYTGCFFQTSSIPLAMAHILPLFDGKMNRFVQSDKIHPQSSIHPSAHLGKNVLIGPFVVIGEGVTIGDNVTIGANTVIEAHAKVGSGTLLHPQVFIGDYCVVGEHCEIHPHTTIGSDGFGYAPNPEGHLVKIPQLGRVILGDRVEIGANCAIDRAALTETKINSGVKMDNLCHIAHNCEIGADSALAGGFMMAGSTKIGRHFQCGGNAVVAGHIEIADQVTLAGRSTVTNDIKESGAYGGYPLQPLRESLKTVASLPQLPILRKQVARILKHLQIEDSNAD